MEVASTNHKACDASHIDSTQFAIFLDKFMETRPGIILMNKFDYLVLTRVSREYVIMFMMEDVETEIMRVRNIDKTMVSKETVRGQSLVRLRVVAKRDIEGVRVECRQDVRVELFQVHKYCGS